MKRAMVLVIFFLLFSGCGIAEVYETVNDVIPVCAVADAPCKIVVELPQDALVTAHDDSGTLYEAPDGAYSILTKVMVSDSFDSAVYTLSGFAQPQLRMDSENACQFAWCTAGEQGEMVCRAKVYRQDDYYYALCFCLREGLGREYNGLINRVFASFTLEPQPSEEAEVFSEDVADEIIEANCVPSIVAAQNIDGGTVRYAGKDAPAGGRRTAQIERA